MDISGDSLVSVAVNLAESPWPILLPVLDTFVSFPWAIFEME